MGCRGFLQCILKLINFFMAMVGVAMIAYSIWMLNSWSQRGGDVVPPAPPSSNSTSNSSSLALSTPLRETTTPAAAAGSSVENAERLIGVRLTLDNTEETGPLVLTTKDSNGYGDSKIKLPVPWFIYAFLIAGIFTSLVTCTGLIGAETNSGCCLSCYSLGLAVLLMAQGTLAAVIYLDDSWETDLPADSTGEEAKAKSFVRTHLFICQIVAIGVLAVEVIGILLSLTLKAMQEGNRRGYESEDEFSVPRSSSQAQRQPLLPQVHGVPIPPSAETAQQGAPRQDAWTTRMREKYGLDVADFTYNPARMHGQQSVPRTSDEPEARSSGCSIM